MYPNATDLELLSHLGSFSVCWVNGFIYQPSARVPLSFPSTVLVFGFNFRTYLQRTLLAFAFHESLLCLPRSHRHWPFPRLLMLPGLKKRRSMPPSSLKRVGCKCNAPYPPSVIMTWQTSVMLQLVTWTRYTTASPITERPSL
jgi:hypothetical protein